MTTHRLPRGMQLLAALLACRTAAAQTTPDLTAWQPVAQALQTPAVAMPGYVRFNLPRVDFVVTMRGVTLAPALVQGGWVGFAGPPAAALLLGDLVVRLPELSPVLAALQARGLEVSAVHNHLMGEDPALAYVHIAGQGPAITWAAQLDTVLRLTGIPRPVQPQPSTGTVDSAAVFGALGLSGRVRGAVAQASVIVVPDTIHWHGTALPPSLILASPLNMQAVGPGRLVATGDFVLTGPQVAPLLAALTQHGILITATHSHLVGESPALTFVHFWGDGTIEQVAGGLRAAIAAARAARP